MCSKSHPNVEEHEIVLKASRFNNINIMDLHIRQYQEKR